MRKFLWVGVMLLLSSACLPQTGSLPQTYHSDLPSNKMPPSLFTQSELEEVFADEPIPSPEDVHSLLSHPIPHALSGGKLEPPISDESNDDYNLEILPGDRPKKEPSFDIPIVINAKVEQFIQYFQTALKNRFSNWLARSEKYIPFMKNLLKENGLPEDLVYMALIESGFNPYAYSRSKASGPWQFIYFTGKRYGLNVNAWVDERRDPEKSTIAAAKYLKDLYDLFECWYLAAAGYNAGENKIVNAMKRYRTEDFWELIKYSYLKQETKDYVPQMIAAALIAKDPEKYGFTDIEYQDPLRYEKVKVPPGLDLRLIAKASEISIEELKDLNPELLRGFTPPDQPEYEIKIPFGKKELFQKNFEDLPSQERVQFKTHVVKNGDTLPKICKGYGVNLEPLLEINQLKKTSRLSPGMNLVIPIPKLQETKPTPIAKNRPQGGNPPILSEEVTYTIKKGDTLWSISSEMGINIGTLSRWNNFHPDRKLMPGDKLKIRTAYASASSVEPQGGSKWKEIIYVVKTGDSIWSIAKKFNLTISEIKTWNNLNGTDRIHPEDRLKLRVEKRPIL